MPDLIEANVLDVEKMTVDEALRHRFKYLKCVLWHHGDVLLSINYCSHLPLGTEVLFCEMDLSQLISQDIMAKFADQIQQRVHQRQQRLKEDRRLDRKVAQLPDIIFKQKLLFVPQYYLLTTERDRFQVAVKH